MRRRDESVNPPENPDPEVFLPLPHLPLHVLLALAEGPRHGWGILKAMEAITAGRETPSSGSLYLAMSRLDEKGLIEECDGPADGDARRKYVRMTPLGRRVLAAETERLARLVELSRAWTAAP